MRKPRPSIVTIESGETYCIERFTDGLIGITCLPCHLTSYHPEDIGNRCCQCCGRYHTTSES
jgi:hypothetical protein